MIRNGLVFFFALSLVIIAALHNAGCANIAPPMGGPRDTLPPRLVMASPSPGSLHVTSNKIVFTFDEFIDPKDLSGELEINPVPKGIPQTYSHLRLLTVKLKDTLQPNTTYYLNFGKAIRDVNEGNILRNFSYVFSTGSYIDSAEFAGQVIVAATGKTDTTLVAMLYKKMDDSAVVKSKPRYVARVDSAGRFHFRYIQPGTYALYALADQGGTLRYLSNTELFAFADSPVVVGQPQAPVTLFAYAEATAAKPNNGTGGGPAGGIKSEKPSKSSAKDKRLQFQTNITAGEFDVLDTFHFHFNSGLSVFDSTGLRFTDENFQDIPADKYHFLMDSTRKTITMFYLSPWPIDTKYHLILAKDFAKDSAGRQLLKIDTIAFSTKKETEYGEVRIRIPNLDLSRNPVLEFLQGDVIKKTYRFGRNKVFREQLFPPGDYELRILYDTNGNGVWDPGSFFKVRRQPEIVQTIMKKFSVKANWDNEKDISL